jgi:hypothetical protein
MRKGTSDEDLDPIRGSAATLAIATTLGALVPPAAAQPAAASLPVTKTADPNDGACDSDCSVGKR